MFVYWRERERVCVSVCVCVCVRECEYVRVCMHEGVCFYVRECVCVCVCIIHQPLYSTWVADFILRQDAGKFMLGKYLGDKKTPWRRRTRFGGEGDALWQKLHQEPFSQRLSKIGKMQAVGCHQCRIAREARGESTDGLAVETYGHINSAGCEGMALTVTAAHHSIWRHLYDSMHAAQKPKAS